MQTDELAQHLEFLKRESCYRVDAVLKQSPVEVTQRVFFQGGNGVESGPYIRKVIQRSAGIGGAYEQIYAAQQRGHRFKHIPDVLECYTRADELVVVMELVRGQTLQDAVYEHDPSLQLAREIFPLLCDAAAELHVEFEPPIIHRDLKPSNIILTGESLVLIDFGISREYRDDAESDTTHFGTREFAPPEQYGFGQTGVYSDVYALGMVLYFCLTEKIPSAQARNQAFRDPGIPEELRQVILGACALDPAMRYASALELKAAFLAALEALDGACAGERNGATGNASRTVRGAAREGIRGDAPVGVSGGSREGAAAVAPDGMRGGEGNPPRSGRRRDVWGAVAAIACALLVAAIGLGVSRNHADGPSQTEAAQAEATASTASEEAPSAGNETAAEADTSSTAAATSAEAQIAEGIETSATPKNGFNPDTNFTLEIAGLEFQVPSYFKANVHEENGVTYYYAESGSSVAMLMAGESEMDFEDTYYGIQIQKDEYVEGVLDGTDILDEVVSSTDYELDGKQARVVTARGTIQGIPLKTVFAFFFNEEEGLIGAIIFGQTVNVQFDYSQDFAKVIASARAI